MEEQAFDTLPLLCGKFVSGVTRTRGGTVGGENFGGTRLPVQMEVFGGLPHLGFRSAIHRVGVNALSRQVNVLERVDVLRGWRGSKVNIR